METLTQKKVTRCRFCLCPEKKKMLLIANALDTSLTIDDVERCSGIRILQDEAMVHAMCYICLDGFHKFTNFRHACMRNDATFRQLHQFELAIKEQPEPVLEDANFQNAKPLKLEVDILELVEADPLEYIDEGSLLDAASNAASESPEIAEEAYETSYSANYIELGEPMSDTDDESDRQKAPKKARKKYEYVRSVVPVLLTNLAKQMPRDRESGTASNTAKKRRIYKRSPVLCELCGKQVVNFGGHILTHREATFECPHCPVKMTNSANFNKHVRAVHEKRIIKCCELCGKGFTHKASYISHMSSKHDIGKLHECSVCGKKFKHPSGLNDHIIEAHRYESYECETCGSFFQSRQKLKKHQRSHSDDQPYGCRHCDKQFKTSYGRNIHEVTHAGVKFGCSLCGKSYRYKAHLTLHMRKIHHDFEEIYEASEQSVVKKEEDLQEEETQA